MKQVWYVKMYRDGEVRETYSLPYDIAYAKERNNLVYAPQLKRIILNVCTVASNEGKAIYKANIIRHRRLSTGHWQLPKRWRDRGIPISVAEA